MGRGSYNALLFSQVFSVSGFMLLACGEVAVVFPQFVAVVCLGLSSLCMAGLPMFCDVCAQHWHRGSFVQSEILE